MALIQTQVKPLSDFYLAIALKKISVKISQLKKLSSLRSLVGSNFKYYYYEYVFMYVILKDQKILIEQAIKKAGSERKLARILGVVRSTIYFYKYKKRPINGKVFYKMIKFLDLGKKGIKSTILIQLDDHWKQQKGGKNCYLKKVKTGTFEQNLIKMKKASKEMHKKLKKELGRKYYLEQYRRFKLIGKYKMKTERGELVRNILEKKIADILFQLSINYQYEPYVRANSNHYFPDFKIGNVILECTMWDDFDKAIKLQKKISDFKKAGYKVFVIVPNKLRKYYQRIESYLIEENDIKSIVSPRTMPS